FARGLLDQRLQYDRHDRQIVEDRLKLLDEERQPVLHARMTTALADGFRYRILHRPAAELRRIVHAETSARLVVELDFAGRHEIELVQLRDRPLAFGIEGADRFKLVAEKIEPDGCGGTGCIEIDDAAAYRVLAEVAHRRGAGEAVRLQPAHDVVHRADLSGLQVEALRLQLRARGHALQGG